MEFLLYLSPQGQQLIRDIISARFYIQENVGLCRNKQIFGHADTPREFVVCTKNIKNGGWNMKHYVSETVYHESIHAAQICNGDKPLGISKKYMPLSSNKLQDIRNSIIATKNYNSGMKEHEAYYFEDKPTQVRYYVRKFCF